MNFNIKNDFNILIFSILNEKCKVSSEFLLNYSDFSGFLFLIVFIIMVEQNIAAKISHE
jgi:hypothetical protein